MGLNNVRPADTQRWAKKQLEAIWTNLGTNHLWQRMLKNTLATTIAIILSLIPSVVAVYGQATYLAAIVTVFGHPGRRFGMMAEALVLAVCGTLTGVAWSVFGIYLSSLVYEVDSPAAYTIKGLFLMVAVLVHGFLRSHAPRLFIFVLLLIIVSVVGLTGTSTVVSKTFVTVLLYPILTSVGILLLVNLLVFPEFSSSYLGVTTIETLGETVVTLRDSGRYFVHVAGDPAKELSESHLPENLELKDKPPTAAERTPETSEPTKFHKLINCLPRRNRTEPTLPKKTELPTKKVLLKSLTDAKAKLRAKLASCKAAQTECNFELAWAVLPPRDLKPIGDTQMRKLVANTIALIGACESKYALMGDDDEETKSGSKDENQASEVRNSTNIDLESESESQVTTSEDDHTNESGKRKKEERKMSVIPLQKEKEELELVKPKREIESGDAELLRFLVTQISKPLEDIQAKIDESVNVISSCLAYCYDVPKLPSGARAPTGISLEEIDIHVDFLTKSLAVFDRDSAQALESAATLHELAHLQVDVMPRMETFLISSFLLNLRQAALRTLEMLHHSRIIVEKRQARQGRRRLYVPRINWRKWLTSGGEEDALALPASGRKDVRTGKREDDIQDDDEDSIDSQTPLTKKKDVETGSVLDRHAKHSPKKDPYIKGAKSGVTKDHERTLMLKLRNWLAGFIEYLAGSEDVLYALKLTIAVFLVTWPAFVGKWNAWFSANRGLWAALQLVLITEVAIGTSVATFTLRGFGTIIGCLWGWAAYEARDGNPFVCVVLLVIGIIPSTYIQLGTKYTKAGMVSIVSMCIVALAIELHTTPGTPTSTFLERLIAFLIGGVVALVVEVVLFPVKARDRLVESLASSVIQISEMEACLAYGIETETNVDVHSDKVQKRFDRAKTKAQGALQAAETFLPFCANEPRLKGSFKGLALVYAEVLYVLHAVVDRMDNMLQLRHEYGSGVLEELNEKVYPYRRNVAGAITLVLFAVHEALTTKLPLPQFLPSARLAHLRMVNRVREVVMAGDLHEVADGERSELEITMVKRVVRRKYLSWNAASAGQIEVVEYLEELVDLVKLLFGASEFRSGLLTRPTYRGYIDRISVDACGSDTLDGTHEIDHHAKDDPRIGEQNELRDTHHVRRRASTAKSKEKPSQGNLSIKPSLEKLDKAKQHGHEELPISLQRVRSKRIEELQLQKSKSQDAKAKGKKVV